MTKVLRMALLGPAQVTQDGAPLAGLASGKAQALLYFLAVTGRPYSRQALAGLLWGELAEADARRNLRGVVMKLRQAVPDHLIVNYQDLAFDGGARSWLDVTEFSRALSPAQGSEVTLVDLQTAVQLYRGDFLEDFHVRQAPAFTDWAAQQQLRLWEQVLGAYHELITLFSAAGEYERGIAAARQQLTLDPAREEGHRQLMWLLAMRGQRSAALTQFETCRTVLAAELGVAPGEETAALYAQIRAGDLRETAVHPAAARILPASPTPVTVTPFLAGPPVTRPGQFFGRERELKRIFNLIRRLPLQNAAIIGPRRSGKTSLLHYIRAIHATPAAQLRQGQRQEWLSSPEHYRWIFVDFQDPRLGTQQALLQHLLKHMGFDVPTPCALDHFLDVVSDQLTSPTIVLLDEIGVAMERYPELDDAFWESLRSLATNQVGGNLAFILAAAAAPYELAQYSGLGSPFFNIFGYTAWLGPLSETAARALIASSPLPITEDDVVWILAQSEKWPMLLQILCRERLLSLEEGESGSIWREEALQQLTPFRDLTTHVD